MVEINPCVESGCPGLCCQDVDLGHITPSERTRCFKKSKHFATFTEIARMRANNKEGVYYTEDPEGKLMFYAVSIVGKCPNLDQKGNCKIHMEREHAARKTPFGGSYCNYIRGQHNLPQIKL